MRKRGKRRPTIVLIDPVKYVMTGLMSARSSVDTHRAVLTRAHSAMQSLSRGQADDSVFQALVDMLNLAEALAKSADLGIEHLPQIEVAQQALIRISQSKRRGATGIELTALNWAVEIHEA